MKHWRLLTLTLGLTCFGCKERPAEGPEKQSFDGLSTAQEDAAARKQIEDALTKYAASTCPRAPLANGSPAATTQQVLDGMSCLDPKTDEFEVHKALYSSPLDEGASEKWPERIWWPIATRPTPDGPIQSHVDACSATLQLARQVSHSASACSPWRGDIPDSDPMIHLDDLAMVAAISIRDDVIAGNARQAIELGTGVTRFYHDLFRGESTWLAAVAASSASEEPLLALEFLVRGTATLEDTKELLRRLDVLVRTHPTIPSVIRGDGLTTRALLRNEAGFGFLAPILKTIQEREEETCPAGASMKACADALTAMHSELTKRDSAPGALFKNLRGVATKGAGRQAAENAIKNIIENTMAVDRGELVKGWAKHVVLLSGLRLAAAYRVYAMNTDTCPGLAGFEASTVAQYAREPYFDRPMTVTQVAPGRFAIHASGPVTGEREPAVFVTCPGANPTDTP